MCEESAFYQRMVHSYAVGPIDYEDPKNLFPMKEDQRNVMRACHLCRGLHDINIPSTFHHTSFFRVTIPVNQMGHVIGKGGSYLKKIREWSKVSVLTIPTNGVGRSRGEVQVQGGQKEVEQAFSMIKWKVRGFVTASWDCCQRGVEAHGCVNESIRELLISYGFLNKSMVVATQSRGLFDSVKFFAKDSMTRRGFLLNKSMVVATQSRGLVNFGKVFALDCEMVNTTRGKELARVTMLDFNGDTCYDTLVKPPEGVVDYNTIYSGITPEMMDNTTTTLADVQRSLLKIVSSNDILVGHSIDNDLRSLHLEHRKVVDTSRIFPHPDGTQKRPSLKILAQRYLNREIQQHGDGHDSKEDALAALDLMKWKCVYHDNHSNFVFDVIISIFHVFFMMTMLVYGVFCCLKVFVFVIHSFWFARIGNSRDL